jgi:hypothetical protein
MEIMFSMKLKKDGKTLQMLFLCSDCRQQLAMATGGKGVRFRCQKHGELGSLTAQEFANGVQQAQEKAAKQYGLGKPVRMKIMPAEPTIQ